MAWSAKLFIGKLAVIFRYPESAEADPGVPVLNVEVVDNGRTVTVAVRGDVDIATVKVLEAGIRHGLRKNPDQLALHLSDVSFFGAAGLHALLAAQRQAHEQAVELLLRAPSSWVLNVLRLARLNGLFAIEDEPPDKPVSTALRRD